MTLKSLSHFDRTQRSLAVLADDYHSRLAFRVESHAILRYEQRVRIVPLTNLRATNIPGSNRRSGLGKRARTCSVLVSRSIIVSENWSVPVCGYRLPSSSV